MQRFEVRDFAGNHSHYDCTGAALHENVNAKSMRTWQAVGDIAGTELFQVVDGMLVVPNQIGRDAPGVIAGECAPSSGRS